MQNCRNLFINYILYNLFFVLFFKIIIVIIKYQYRCIVQLNYLWCMKLFNFYLKIYYLFIIFEFYIFSFPVVFVDLYSNSLITEKKERAKMVRKNGIRLSITICSKRERKSKKSITFLEKDNIFFKSYYIYWLSLSNKVARKWRTHSVHSIFNMSMIIFDHQLC